MIQRVINSRNWSNPCVQRLVLSNEDVIRDPGIVAHLTVLAYYELEDIDNIRNIRIESVLNISVYLTRSVGIVLSTGARCYWRCFKRV